MSTEQRLIDANDLKKKLDGLEASGGHKYYRKGMNDTLHFHMPNIIDECPTVDAAPVVHGRWLKPSEQGLPKKFDNFGAVCSVCGFYSESPNNYCPNCGCKMDTETIKRQAEYVYEGVSRYCEAIDKNNLVNEIVEEMRNALR